MKKYIGNVIVRNMNYRVDEWFRKCLSVSDADSTLPSLIIGLEAAKENIEGFSILTKRYSDGKVWWTFSKTERRVDYEKDLTAFRDFCIRRISENFTYKLLNVAGMSYSQAKRAINFIMGCREKQYYVDNGKFIFVMVDRNDAKPKEIFGISLTTCEFLGISGEKVLKMFEDNPFNRRIRNFYPIPNSVRRSVNDDIPSEMLLLEYF